MQIDNSQIDDCSIRKLTTNGNESSLNIKEFDDISCLREILQSSQS